MSLVMLTTDFGYQDYFVGAMKGVILAINPTATIVDLSHAIQPGAYTLWHAAREFPDGSSHVAGGGTRGPQQPAARVGDQ